MLWRAESDNQTHSLSFGKLNWVANIEHTRAVPFVKYSLLRLCHLLPQIAYETVSYKKAQRGSAALYLQRASLVTLNTLRGVDNIIVHGTLVGNSRMSKQSKTHSWKFVSAVIVARYAWLFSVNRDFCVLPRPHHIWACVIGKAVSMMWMSFVKLILFVCDYGAPNRERVYFCLAE